MPALPLQEFIESIHTASLLHDDVVDSADIRRGKTPAHSIWGNQVVILMGDFLYSKRFEARSPAGKPAYYGSPLRGNNPNDRG